MIIRKKYILDILRLINWAFCDLQTWLMITIICGLHKAVYPYCIVRILGIGKNIELCIIRNNSTRADVNLYCEI